MAAIWVVAEHKEGKIKKVSLELIGKAKALGGDVAAVLLGDGVEGLAGELGKYGAAKVYLAESADLKSYTSEAWVNVIAALAKANNPDIILLGATVQGKDWSPKLAARLEAGLATDCTGLDMDGGALVATRPIYAGKAFAKVAFKGKPAIASVRPNVMPLGAADGGAPEVVKVDAAAGDVKTKVLEIQAAGGGKIELTEADAVVSGGRGMKGPEHFKLLEDLAEVLGAAVGASRAAVDAGWRGHADQVGQTGKVVSPTLYIAAGISGAIQHLAGMSSSKVIVAINKDPEAPIFKIADYGIEGDLFEVLPKLTEEIKKLKA